MRARSPLLALTAAALAAGGLAACNLVIGVGSINTNGSGGSSTSSANMMASPASATTSGVTGASTSSGATTTSSATSSGAGTTGATSSSSSGGTLCDPAKNPAVVADACGTFVSPTGDDMNPGTKEQPLKTLTAALGKGTIIYACAGVTPYTEALSVTTAVAMYGSLECSTWIYKPTNKTQLTAAANAVPLTLASGAGGTIVQGFGITSIDATTPGGSSVAVLDDGAELTLENVDIVAGAGAPGAPGMAQPAIITLSQADGQAGGADPSCTDTNAIDGGPGGANTCGASATPTNGGAGGQSKPDTGGSGFAGMPLGTNDQGAGQLGATPCGSGQTGTPGGVGAVGVGARGIGDVQSTGYVAAVPAPGMPGGAGQGGGGGGAAYKCNTSFANSGPSGGGGGAGGCGGAPGLPGQSGGSSFGVIALAANLTLNNLTIHTGAGGIGGLGGDGQKGGAGGKAGAAGGLSACGGGVGAAGGNGGAGGGGAGGHSVAIAVKGVAAPSIVTTSIGLATTAASGGAGGDNDMTATTKGDPGMLCAVLDFTTGAPSPCTM